MTMRPEGDPRETCRRSRRRWHGRQRPWQSRGTPVTRRHDADDGFTLIELVVSFALFAVVVGIAVPHLRGRNYDLWGAHAQLMADLRQARADAITRGDHFAVVVTEASGYEVRRLRDDDGNGVWVPDATPFHRRTLPDHVRFVAGLYSNLEYNTRGLMVIPDAADALVLQDEHSGATKTVTVWPSGQVAPVEIPE